jgi:hypothetical protein
MRDVFTPLISTTRPLLPLISPFSFHSQTPSYDAIPPREERSGAEGRDNRPRASGTPAKETATQRVENAPGMATSMETPATSARASPKVNLATKPTRTPSYDTTPPREERSGAEERDNRPPASGAPAKETATQRVESAPGK